MSSRIARVSQPCLEKTKQQQKPSKPKKQLEKDGFVGTDTWHQAWWLEFEPQNPQEERHDSWGCLLISTCAPQINTWKHLKEKPNKIKLNLCHFLHTSHLSPSPPLRKFLVSHSSACSSRGLCVPPIPHPFCLFRTLGCKVHVLYFYFFFLFIYFF